ncbi:MAG: hypothetical protein AAF560_02525 [Acidobacteriota bacterium]
MIRLATHVSLFAFLMAPGFSWGQTPLALKILPADPSTNQFFGLDVDLEGSVMVVGALGESSTAQNAGSAYIFERVADEWIEQIKLEEDPPVSLNLFGNAVATDGVTIAVGALGDATMGALSGAVSIYRRDAGEWSFQQRLFASNSRVLGEFGDALAIEGETLIAGAPGDNSACPDDLQCLAGAIYVFEEVAGAWSELIKLVPSDVVHLDAFGTSVAFDGTTIVGGAPNHAGHGAVYVFEQVGGVWTETQKLVADDAAPGDIFGSSIALRGSTIVVGARNDDDAGEDSGSAYVFEQIGGSWTQSQKLAAFAGAAGENFGAGIAFAGDTLAIGASRDSHSGIGAAGSVVLFRRVGATWVETKKLVAADPRSGHTFGDVVASDGAELAIGVWGDDDGGEGAGAVYLGGSIFADGFESGDTSNWS